MTPILSERSVDRDRESAYHIQSFLYKILRVLMETLSRQDSKKLFKGAEGILWSLRLNSATHTSAQDTCRIVPGAVRV